jgi:hypothetical protein
MIFSGDGTGVPDTWRGNRDAAIEWGINWPRQDLNPIAVAMSRVTKHIGFGLTHFYTTRCEADSPVSFLRAGGLIQSARG